MAKNSNLHAAKVAKNDEFYTMLTDIEKEMSHYKDFFKGKVVYCNCDDARESNFFKYFSKNFEFLGLKKLITTGYKAEGKGVVLVYEGDKNGNRKVDDAEVEVRELQGSGDFRSAECIEFLKEADVVVTNPPFSLFREYVKQLLDYGKKFIIVGNKNAICYKEIFPYIKEDKLWVGVTMKTGCRFYLPESTEETTSAAARTEEDGRKTALICGAHWFTNIVNPCRNQPLDLYKRYSNEYKHYDNYDAIEVSKSCDIPMDYDGIMGVPITFLDKYCPAQFEIVGATESEGKGFSNGLWDVNSGVAQALVNGQKVYKRIFIKRRVS